MVDGLPHMKGDGGAHHQHSQAHARAGIPDARACEGGGHSRHAQTPDSTELGQRDSGVPPWTPVWASRKRKEDGDSPNKPCMSVTHVSVTTFKNLQSMWMRADHSRSKLQNCEQKKTGVQVPDDTVELRYTHQTFKYL